MGGKQTGTRKQVYLCIALLLILLVAGCRSFSPGKQQEDRQKKDEPYVHLFHGKTLFGDGDFAGAVRELEKAVTPAASKSYVAEEALLYLGAIHADPGNPKRDHAKAVAYFKKLADGCRRSVFSEQARIILAVMKENDESTRTIDRLKAVIEASKKVDREIEEKRREKTGK